MVKVFVRVDSDLVVKDEKAMTPLRLVFHLKVTGGIQTEEALASMNTRIG